MNRRKGGDPECEELTKAMKNLDYLTSENMVINEKWVVTAEQTILIIPKVLGSLLKSGMGAILLFTFNISFNVIYLLVLFLCFIIF